MASVLWLDFEGVVVEAGLTDAIIAEFGTHPPAEGADGSERSLAAAIAYPEIVSVFVGTVNNLAGRPVEVMAVTLAFYAGVSFLVAWLMGLSTVLAIAAFIFGYLVYARRNINLEGTRRAFGWALRVAENKYFVDEVYQWTVDRVVLSFSGFIAWVDRALVNDVGINGPGDITRALGDRLKYHVTGYVYTYALAMALGLIGLAIFWWLVSR